MAEDPYVRFRLRTTHDRTANATTVVKHWLVQAQNLLATAPPKYASWDAYNALALWAKFRRTRPELVDRTGGTEVWRQLRELVARHGVDFARAAVTAANPAAWQEQVEELRRSYEELWPTAERVTFAEQILTDLDDAELMLYAARAHGVYDEPLEEQIQQCRDLLMEEADIFLAARVHIQAVGMTIRPELADTDYDLGLTALKYERLLNAMEDAEAELNFVDVQPFPGGISCPLLVARQTPYRVRRIQHPAWTTALAAGAQMPSAPVILKWRSPDNRFYAYLSLPGEPPPELYVQLCTAAGDAARQLAGQPVFLAGRKATVDSRGIATFVRSEIPQDAEVLLEVGVDRQIWHPAE